MRHRPFVLLALAGCGRFGFDPVDDESDATNDAVFPSCVDLAPTCGPTGSTSCCESPLVPGGAYYRSYDGVGFDDMGFPATVASFRLDRYEVTVGRFRAFVAAGAMTPSADTGAHADLPDSGWDPSWNSELPATTAALIADLDCDGTIHSWTDTTGASENLPISCVSWYAAMAFCIWDGGYLPTEAEWNHAAAGGQQRAYPWSSPPSSTEIVPAEANFGCLGDGVAGCSVTDYVPVGSLSGAGAWAHSDLGGNVWEWVLDVYDPDYPLPCIDCARLSGGSDRTMRGGSLYNSSQTLRQGVRANDDPRAVRGNFGVRCARRP